MLLRIRTVHKRAHAAGAVRVAAAAVLLLSACSTDNPLSLRPDVDLGDRTASLAPDIDDNSAAEPQGEQPMPEYVMPEPDTAPAEFSEPVEAAAPAGEPGVSDMTDISTAEASDSPYVSASLTAPEMGGGVAEPDMAGAAAADTIAPAAVETDMVSAAPATDASATPEIGTTELVEPATAVMETAQPAVSQHRIGSLDELDPLRPAAQEEPTEPYLIASLPRVDNPVEEEPREIMPADEIDCRRELEKLGVVYKDLDPISDGEACGIEHPVKISAIGKVKIVPAATLRCEMAAAFATWTKKELVPAAKSRYLTGVKAIHQGSSYSCRNVRRSRTLSEHGKGNALDVSRIELNGGRDIDVKKPGWLSFRKKGFLNSVRSDGCEYFTTVLGPGYDRDHKDHFHFDLKARRNGFRACR